MTEQKDSDRVSLSQDRRTPLAAVITFQDEMTPLELFYNRRE